MQQLNFSNLTKGGRDSVPITCAEEFDSRVGEALAKIERQLDRPDLALDKRMRSEVKMEWKLNLREQFHMFAAERKP